MPAEVISLLSSPDPPVVSPPHPTAIARRKSTPPPKRRTTPPQRALHYDDDDDDDDPFGEVFPVGSSRLSRSNHKPAFAAFRVLPNITQPTRIQPAVASDDIWSLDDDADFPGPPSPKRQRLTSDTRAIGGREVSLTAGSRASAATSNPAQRRSPAKAKRLASTLEPVEFTSSPRRSSVKTAKSRNPFLHGNYDSDPFGSSPPRKQKETQKTGASNAVRYAGEQVEINVDDDDDDGLFVRNSPINKLASRQPSNSVAAWDPISSSAPLPTAAAADPKPSRPMKRSFSEVITLDDSDDDDDNAMPFDDDGLMPPQPGSDSEDFPDIDKLEIPNPADRWRDSAAYPKSAMPIKPKARSKAPAVKRSAEEIAQEKERKAAEREAEKERKKQERENKKLEKQKASALAEVNKIRTDKRVSTPEMIVDLPTTLSDTVKLQAEVLLKGINVQAETWTSPVDNVVTWRRKVRSRYNEEAGHWEPIPMRVQSETYAMVILTAAEFVHRARGSDGNDLESHVLSMQRAFPTHTKIYLIEGLTPWMRKNRNLRNRRFVSAVRTRLPDDNNNNNSTNDPTAPPPRNQARGRKTTTTLQEYIPEETIDTALLQLQVLHSVLIHHTSAPVETAQWIAVFTQHISTVPYRRQREESNDAAAAFCMDAGQVRAGDGARDTYVRMLQEIGRVTVPIAWGIAAEFGSVAELVKGLEREGPLALQDVRKSANKDGAVSDRVVGQAVSRRMHKIFTGRDEGSTEV